MINKKNIILIGMPAAGKSTVGVILAKKAGFSFIDTDVYIQTQEGRRLPEIIRDEGIEGFCRVEESHVLTIRETSCVIATGGSVIYGEKAMKHLADSGTIVYLKTEMQTLLERLVNLEKRGVVRQPGQTFETLYLERHPIYSVYADIVIDCSLLSSPVDTADVIANRLGVSI